MLSSIVLFISAIYLLVKILRIVKFKGDPALILSITSISFALACLFTFFFIDTVEIVSFNKQSFIHFEINSNIVI